MTIYTIEIIQEASDEFKEFLKVEVPNISKMFNDVFNFMNCPYMDIIKNHKVIVCKRNGEITGMLICGIRHSTFDRKTKMLIQDLFYVKPDSGRTAYHLFKKFIDIGKREADHIITMLTSQTNIKPKTLEKLGFYEMETLYRLEV